MTPTTDPTGTEILAVPMGKNDAGAATVGDYLGKLLLDLWREGEGFDGKRPFGNSSWEYELYVALARADVIPAALDEDGYWDGDHAVQDRANELIERAITAALPPPPLAVADIPAGQGAASLFLKRDDRGYIDLFEKGADGGVAKIVDLDEYSAALADHLAATLPIVTEEAAP